MKTISTFSFLFLLLYGCKKALPDSYYVVPDYIVNATGNDQKYYEAYDKTMTLWNVDYKDLYIPTSHGTAHVIISGPENAQPLVLLHGMTASSTMWYPNAKALSKDYRLYAIDLIIEPGKSKLTKDFNSIDELIHWYDEVFIALKLDEFSLIGVSRGGWLAVNILLNNQQHKIKSLVLISPAQTLIWIPPSENLIKNIIYQLSSDEKRMYLTFKTLSEDVDNIEEEYLRQNYLGDQIDSNNKFVIGMQPYSSQELQSIKVPTLVLIGDDDLMNNSRSLEVAQKNIPNVTTQTVSNAGHFLSVDQAEDVNNKILMFLDNIYQKD